MNKERLFILAPKGGSLEEYLGRFPYVYKRTATSPYYVYFQYFGDTPPKEKVCNLLLVFDFKDFSFEKDNSYYRLTVNTE